MCKTFTWMGWLGAVVVVLTGLTGCGSSEAPSATTDTDASREAAERYKAGNPQAKPGQLPPRPGRPSYAR